MAFQRKSGVILCYPTNNNEGYMDSVDLRVKKFKDYTVIMHNSHVYNLCYTNGKTRKFPDLFWYKKYTQTHTQQTNRNVCGENERTTIEITQ